MTAKEHNRLVGIFLMAHGAWQTFFMLLMCAIYAVMGGAMMLGGRTEGDQFVGVVFIAMIAFIFIFSLAFIIPQIVGGWKIYKERPNARTWGIIGSILSCMSFPIGTAAGVYSMWFLFGEEGKRFYLGGVNQNVFQPQQPIRAPEPGSWQ